MNKNAKKALTFMMALLLTLTAFAACSGGDEGKQDEEQMQTVVQPEVEETVADGSDKTETEEPAVQRNDLVIVMESEPPTMHPFEHTSVTAGYMNVLTYNSLFKTDPVTLEPVPDLCASYTQIDECTWEFSIHENVQFHDGSMMTAEDVVASMEYAREYATTKQYSQFWTSLETVDNYTIRLTTDGPYALTLVDMASLKVVPKALIEAENDFNQNPIGSGPYKFASQTLGDKIEFEAFDDYFDDEHTAKIRYLTWRIIPEGSSRTIALEAGEADFIIEVETNDLERLSVADTVEVQTVPGTRMNYFLMNNEVAPFDNQDFRKAVNAAIDREAVLTVALNGEGKAAQGMCPSVFEGSAVENSETYDPEKAQEYLMRSGVDPSTVTFSCIVATDATRRAAEVIQAYLQEIGLTMTIESLDYAAWLSDVMSGNCTTAVTGYTASALARYLGGTFHTSAINAANQSRVRDLYVDQLIDLGLTQTDVAAQTETYMEVTAYLNKLTPYVPLYESVVTRAYRAGLEGVVVGSNGTVRFEDIFWAE